VGRHRQHVRLKLLNARQDRVGRVAARRRRLDAQPVRLKLLGDMAHIGGRVCLGIVVVERTHEHDIFDAGAGEQIERTKRAFAQR
jgi:hypothetical protein